MSSSSIILGCAIIILGVAYAERDRWIEPRVVYVKPPVPAAPTPRPRHLAPEGTFFVVEYIAVRTPHGVAGFEPGAEVHLVSVDKAKGTLLVSDGKYETAVDPSCLTNDIDLAALARRQDQRSQYQLKAAQENDRRAYEKEIELGNLQHAADVAGVKSGATISQADLLTNQKAQRTNTVVHTYPGYYYNGTYVYSGNPYSYLQ